MSSFAERLKIGERLAWHTNGIFYANIELVIAGKAARSAAQTGQPWTVSGSPKEIRPE